MYSSEKQLTPEQANDVEWLAFCYVADEMSADERARFESRLSSDQAAREAVATAVELTQTIAAAEPIEQTVELAPRRFDRVVFWQRATWIATTTAACLAVVLGYQLVSQVLQQGDRAAGFAGQKEAGDGEADELAQAWLEAGDDESLDDSSADQAPPQAATETAGGDELVGIFEADDVEAPDWMLAAVNGLSAEAMDKREQ